MEADQFIAARVTSATKARLRALATQQGLSESALLKRVIDAALGTADIDGPGEIAGRGKTPRGSRLYVRLYPDDRLLLSERAHSRSMSSATYVAVLVRSHLRGMTPLPREEIQAFKRAVAALGAVGRNLNQIARAIHQNGSAVLGRPNDVATMLRICTALRDHFKAAIRSNELSWKTGYDVSKH